MRGRSSIRDTGPAGRPLQPRSLVLRLKTELPGPQQRSPGCAEPSSEHAMKIKLLPKGGKRNKPKPQVSIIGKSCPPGAGAAPPGWGQHGLPRVTETPGMALRRWGRESGGQGRKKEGSPGPGSRDWRAAGRCPPGGRTPVPPSPLRGQCLGKRHKPKAGHQGPRSPWLTRRSLQAFPASARALRGRTTVLLPSEPPHQQAAAASKVSDPESNKLGGHILVLPTSKRRACGKKTSEKRSDSWRRDLCLLCISSRAW